ncbi:MAG: tyrosine-type recombinase/integrase [Cyanobacteria bacterium P01_E01_bin.42]
MTTKREITALLNKLKAIDGGKFATRGQVNLERYRHSIRLRWSVGGKRHSMTIKGGICFAAVQVAIARCDLINSDIAFNRFDPSLAKYDSDRPQPEKRREPNLKDVWEAYKEANEHKISPTTKKRKWRDADLFLEALPPEQLNLSRLEILGREGLKIISLGTLHRIFQSLNPAVKLYTGTDPKLKSQLPSEPKNPIEWFEPEEVKNILRAFADNRYSPDKSNFSHSFYYPYVCFLSHTGCRPEEIPPLTWNSLKWSKNNTVCRVKIDRVYSKGIIVPYPKNRKNRIILLSSTLIGVLLEHQKEAKRSNQLIFSGVQGGWFDHDNFRKRHWVPILEGLVKDKLISQYLPPYNLRHSYVTNTYYFHKLSFTEIAGIIGDNPETVIKRYTGIKAIDPENVPDLY